MHTATDAQTGSVPVNTGVQETLPAAHHKNRGWLLRQDAMTVVYSPQLESECLSPHDVFQLAFNCGCHASQRRDGAPISWQVCGLHGAAVLATKQRRSA
jgi:hypothetical protein